LTLFLLGAIALPALLLAGCGDSASEPAATGASGGKAKQAPAETAKQEPGVTEAEIEEAKAGSPEKTVLEWWAHIQANEPEEARPLYLEPPSLPDLAGQFNLVSEELAGTVKIAVSEEQEDGSSIVKARWSKPSGKTELVELRLAKDGEAWKIVEDRFVNELVEEIQEEEEKE
jgi:outer membrane murein-binding lipoprotein Lpp